MVHCARWHINDVDPLSTQRPAFFSVHDGLSYRKTERYNRFVDALKLFAV